MWFFEFGAVRNAGTATATGAGTAAGTAASTGVNAAVGNTLVFCDGVRVQNWHSTWSKILSCKHIEQKRPKK